MTDHKHQQLLNALKALWAVQTQEHDAQALTLLDDYLQSNNTQAVTQEEYAIQQKVLAKTREKTEVLLKRIEALEKSL